MSTYYLYKITNTLNSKVYVGITKNPVKRKAQHFKNRKSHKTISLIKQAIDKYGEDNFSFEILCVGSKNYILDLEVRAICAYRATEKRFGYNIKAGGQGGAGYEISKTCKDVSHYVSGFWFPSVRCALKHMNMDKSTFLRRRSQGLLGDIEQAGMKRDWSLPLYVAGFWFPNLSTACKILSRSDISLMARVRKGSVEQSFSLREQSGENNHMFGVLPEKHPSSKGVIVFGKKYFSIKQATEDTGFSKYVINRRIKEGDPNFSYIINEDF